MPELCMARSCPHCRTAMSPVWFAGLGLRSVLPLEGSELCLSKGWLPAASSPKSHLLRESTRSALRCPHPSPPFCLSLSKHHHVLFLRRSLERMSSCSERKSVDPCAARLKFGNLTASSGHLNGKLHALHLIRNGCDATCRF